MNERRLNKVQVTAHLKLLCVKSNSTEYFAQGKLKAAADRHPTGED